MGENEVPVSDRRGFPRLLWGMIVRPRKTLRYLNERGGSLWWLPALLAALMTVLPVVAGAPLAAEQAREAIVASQERMAEQQGMELSEEQQAQMEGLVASPLIIVVFPAIGAVLGVAIGWLTWSGILYLAGMAFGGRSTFGALLGVVVWTWLPYALRGLLQTAYILISGQLITHPGLSGLVSSAPSVEEMIAAPPSLGQLALTSFLTQVDLFLFWRLALMAVGVVVVMRLPWRKAVPIVVGVWLLLTALGLVPTLIGGMFSGMVAGT
jgi:hypothetical protein